MKKQKNEQTTDDLIRDQMIIQLALATTSFVALLILARPPIFWAIFCKSVSSSIRGRPIFI